MVAFGCHHYLVDHTAGGQLDAGRLALVIIGQVIQDLKACLAIGHIANTVVEGKGAARAQDLFGIDYNIGLLFWHRCHSSRDQSLTQTHLL